MAVTVARLEAILSADTGRFDRSMRQSESRMKRVGGAAKLMGVALAGAAVVELKRAVDAAIDAERAQSRLEQSFKGAHLAIGPYRKSIEQASTAAINLGFDDETLKDSIGSLIIATGDYGKAQEAANVAMDLARFKGVGLDESTKSLTMAMAGSQRAIKQLGISVSPLTDEYDRLKLKFTAATSAGGENITMAEKLALKTAKLQDKQATAAKTIDIVKDKVRGQAEAYKKTAAGEMEVFRAKIEELEEKLGEKLLPTLKNIVTQLISFVDFMDRLNKKMEAVGGIQGPNLIEMIKRLDKWFGQWHLSVKDIVGDFEDLYGWMMKVVDAAKEVKKWFDKIKGPNIVDAITGDAKNPIFHPPGPRGPIGGGGTGLVSGILDELAGGRSMGLYLASGRRSPEENRRVGGAPNSDHLYGKAIDMAGSPANMSRYFSWLIGQRDVKQAFYDPRGSIFGGMLSSYREGGHSDHVHVATYDKGGYLRPGWNLAYNGLGRPEPVGAGTVNIYLPNYVGSKSEITSYLQNAARQFRRQNGRSMF